MPPGRVTYDKAWAWRVVYLALGVVAAIYDGAAGARSYAGGQVLTVAQVGFSPVSGRAPLWSEGACGRGLRNKNKSSPRVVPNIITVPSSPLTHFYFTESTLNALYTCKVGMPCQNTCKMGSDRSVGMSIRLPQC